MRSDRFYLGGKQSVILLLLVLFGGGSERTSKDRTHRKISLLENGSWFFAIKSEVLHWMRIDTKIRFFC